MTVKPASEVERERRRIAYIMSLPVGTLVHVRYDFSPDIAALVCETTDDDKRFGWVMVEQITDYEVETERPRFLALASMITRKFGSECAGRDS